MELKLLVQLVTIAVTLLISILIYKKYKLTKYQAMIFILLFLFWSAIIIVRAYRKSYANNPVEIGGLALGAAAAATIASGYGFISIFARFLVFYFSDVFKSRKLLISFGLVLVAITSYWVFISPDYYSLLFSSLALGVGASMLSLFNVFFAQTFDAKDAMKSVSILSIAPLLAEFVMSLFQFAYTDKTNTNYGMLWLLSVILSVIAFIFMIFVKDNKPPKQSMSKEKFKTIISHKNTWYFGVVGILVSLVKFALSGSNTITYFQTDIVAMNDFMVAYSDFLYGIAQMIFGILAGLFFASKIGLKKTLLLGVALSLTYNVVLLLTTNPNVLFFTQALGGMGYGLTYNSLIGLAMESVDLDLRDMSMAIFQTFFAIGIFYGDRIYKDILKLLGSTKESMHYNQVFIAILIITFALYLVIRFGIKTERKDESLENNHTI